MYNDDTEWATYDPECVESGCASISVTGAMVADLYGGLEADERLRKDIRRGLKAMEIKRS